MSRAILIGTLIFATVVAPVEAARGGRRPRSRGPAPRPHPQVQTPTEPCGSGLVSRRQWLWGAGSALVLGGGALAGYLLWPKEEALPLSYELPTSVDTFPHKDRLPKLIPRAKIIVHFEQSHFGNNAREARLVRLKEAAEGKFGLAHEGWPADRPITLESLQLEPGALGVQKMHDDAFFKGIEEPVSSAHSGLLSYDLNFRYMNRQIRGRDFNEVAWDRDTVRALLYKFHEVANLFEEGPMVPYFEALKTRPEFAGSVTHLERFFKPSTPEERKRLEAAFMAFHPRLYFDAQKIVFAVLEAFHRDLLAGKFPHYVPDADEREILENYPKSHDADVGREFDRAAWDRLLRDRRDRNFAYFIALSFVELASRAKPMDLHVVLGASHEGAITRLRELAKPHELRIEKKIVSR